MKKNKRGHHEGTICQLKDGRWQGRMMIGYDADTQKPVRKAVYGKTQKEVRDKLNELRRQVEKGKAVRTVSKMPFKEWLDQWLENDVKPTVRQTTYKNYKVIVDTHVKPALGEKTLKQLTVEDFQNLFRLKLEGGTDGKDKKSSSTVRLIYLVCAKALKVAKKKGLIGYSVMEDISPPKKVRKEIRPLPDSEVKLFLEKNRLDRMLPAFYLLVATGMRRGELLGLQWHDVDEDYQYVSIKRSRGTTNSGCTFSEPKTTRSRRKIPLTDEARQVLKEHRERQNAEKTKLGEQYKDHKMIFCREDGVPIYPDVLNYRLKKCLKTAGLGHYRVHDLRHTFATLMLQRDVHPKIVQEILGHSNIGTTLDIYSHVIPGLKEQAIARLGPFLSEATPQKKPEREKRTRRNLSLIA